MKSIVIGVDVGNCDTKTSNTTTASGFSVFSKAPFGATETLVFNEMCYVPDMERFPYVMDKTNNENAFILSLFGIAKEIIFVLKKKGVADDYLQKEISDIESINLGIGLPPAHISTLKEKLIEYYTSRFKNGISFEFNGYAFNLKLERISVYPQDLAAIMTFSSKKEDFITKKYKSYYGIDIGGYTVDVVPIIDKMPKSSDCVSLELGILKMNSTIISSVNREFGVPLDDSHISDILTGEPTILGQDIVDMVNNLAREWSEKIINQLRREGLVFEVNPVVFMGGGSRLLRKQLKGNRLVKACDFIANPRANADGYKKLMEVEIRKGR